MPLLFGAAYRLLPLLLVLQSIDRPAARAFHLCFDPFGQHEGSPALGAFYLFNADHLPQPN